MTTTVTVKAAADKSVSVLLSNDFDETDKESVVPAGATQDFTIYGAKFLVISERQDI